MQTHPLSGALGAEITDIDLSSISDQEFADLRDTFLDRSVIVVRNQNLNPDDHIAFAKRWGEININRFFKPTDTHPEIATLLKEPDQKLNIGGQ
jgi:taurine dioxygenase